MHSGGRLGAGIGVCFIAEKGELPAYLARNGFRLVAVAHVCAARRDLARKLLPEARVYEDAQSLMKAEKTLDFVDIAPPPKDHAPIACAAMARGIHVLCEKPLATSMREAEQVVEEA